MKIENFMCPISFIITIPSYVPLKFISILKSHITAHHISQVMESLDEEPDEDAHLPNTRIVKPNRKTKKNREDQIEHPLVGSVAQTMRGSRGRKTTLYIIGDYLYLKGVLQPNNVFRARCRHFKNGSHPCKASAYMEPITLRVLKFTGQHSCVKDPDMKLQIQMETEMKELAETTSDNLKDIYIRVCERNPSIALRIPYRRICTAMDQRRKAAIAKLTSIYHKKMTK